ncbi:hypothetical protein PILCRDRAFT_826914 [Piloderma croceum F 1598]|uniref:Cytochrome P450 n=1 Tax=Piloderma croceum (strain F 1598) TaxID=765440 RepID=A0A0C3APE2_PILCF|nr:hypothetical protein PILCRDRAFT_826914 [Piloderma croceum F 1598]
MMLPLVATLSAIVILLAWHGTTRRRPLPFPPGPRPYWFLGNVFELPSSHWWIKLARISREYGERVHLQALGQHIILLGGIQIAKELMDRKSCSDRPRLVMCGDLMGFNLSIPLISYGDCWRTYRHITQPVMFKAAVQQFHRVQEAEACRLLGALASSPKDFMSEIRFSAGRIILKATYGMDIASPQDPHILIAEETLARISHALVPGNYLVDIFPWLRYLPTALQLNFQKVVARGKIGGDWVRLVISFSVGIMIFVGLKMRLCPYEYTVREKASGTEKQSFVASLLDQDIPSDKHQDEWADIIAWTAGSMYGAGGETVYATMINFVLAMMQHPEAQRNAHDEIDSIIGRSRMPTFADRPHLPYLEALFKEVLRWRVVLLLGVAHRTTKDDDFRGFNIPEDSIVLANAWAIVRDPANYEDPLKFMPERFLKPEALDPANYVFGFGRRICLGINFAQNEVWIFIACLLWGLHFSKPRASDGTEIDQDVKFTSGFVSCALPFDCHIISRETKSTFEHIYLGK